MNELSKDNLGNYKQDMYLSEIQKRKIVEDNDLISSVSKMDKTPMKIFELAVSCIDTTNPPKDNSILLSKKELFTFFKVVDNDKHSRFKEAIEKMQKQAFFEVREKKGKGYDFKRMLPIPTIAWNDYSDEVFIRFNPDIMPYLIDLKQNFTQYALTDIMELNSKYSIILYKWLCMYYNQYEHYKNNGGRRQEQIIRYKNPSISMQELRVLTSTVNEYPRSDNFETWILKKPIDEINLNTHLNVKYEKEKKGRAIDRIQFYIEKNKIAKNENYKEEQQDTIYLQDKYKKEERELLLSAKAMQSPYTKILSEFLLIGVNDFMDTKLMARLQDAVYPFYDELESLKGLNGVKDHLHYVSNKQLGYSKANVVKYLKTSIESYLVKVKNEHR